jgi:MATE family multidrug resistance protein
MILFYVFRFQLISWYTLDTQVIQIAMPLVAISAFFQLGDGLQVTGLGCLRGVSDVKIPSLVTLVAYWGLSIPGGYYLLTYTKLGVSGVWIGLTVGLYFVSLALFIRFLFVNQTKIAIS